MNLRVRLSIVLFRHFKGSSVLTNMAFMPWKDENLVVRFTSGALYGYKGVKFRDFIKIALSPIFNGSAGSLFNALIKKGGYEYKRLEI